MDESRLVRIENKLDKLSDAIVSIVRVEERMVTLFKKMEAMDERLNSIDARLVDVEKTSTARGAIFRLVDKLAWLFVGGVVVYLLEGWLK
jgi:hypothetical protein